MMSSGQNERVERVIRGGYPLTHEEAFRWATMIADRLKMRPPNNVDDTGEMNYLLNLIFDQYNDMNCCVVTNPRDPEEKGVTWVIATTPHYHRLFPREEIEEKQIKQKDFWNPSIQLPETDLDVNARESMERKGFKLQPFHTSLE